MKKKFAAAAIFLAAAALLAAGVLSRSGHDAVAKIDGRPIGIDEFYVYLYEQKVLFEDLGGSDIWDTDFDGETAQDVAKRNALQRIGLVRAAVRQADRLGISLTEEEKRDALQSARLVFAQMNRAAISASGLTLSRVAGVMEDICILNKVYDQVTGNVVMSERGFAEYFRQYRLENESGASPQTAEELARMEETLRSGYLEARKKEVFNENYDKWSAGSVTVINDSVWYGISIADIAGTVENSLISGKKQ